MASKLESCCSHRLLIHLSRPNWDVNTTRVLSKLLIYLDHSSKIPESSWCHFYSTGTETCFTFPPSLFSPPPAKYPQFTNVSSWELSMLCCNVWGSPFYYLLLNFKFPLFWAWKSRVIGGGLNMLGLTWKVTIASKYRIWVVTWVIWCVCQFFLRLNSIAPL